MFHGTDPREDPVEGFVFVEFEGWNDSPSVRGDAVERPAAHGDFDLPTTRGPRLITISGWCRARAPEVMGHLRSQLMAVLPEGVGRVTVDEFGVTTWADVRVYGAPRFRKRGASGYADWSLSLRAPDPRRYGATHEFPGGEPAYHYGNFPAVPELIVTGSMPSGYAIAGPDGKSFVVTQGLSAGQTHRIDMRTGWVTRDGVLQSGAVGRAEVWEIPPGAGITHALQPVSGTGSLLTRVPDTFI
ncbi:hypothetical protein [Microbacterium sp.]|uniref:hypothetical protein n=1 Tax=Microbacterium sp. TaxID=51671 RepID=UPI003A8FEE7D